MVAFGGGHGLSATLQALQLITRNLTAVVTVADDGGSSGRLRQEVGVLPPGDLRMALSALCEDTQWGHTWKNALQYRFDTDGPLDYHSMGNLLITTMWNLLGDEVAGLDWVAKLLRCQGRVLPMAGVPLTISADVKTESGIKTIVGQSKVASCGEQIIDLRLTPDNPPVRPEVIAAIAEADWLVMGPGSWYTSVLPHLMLPQIRAAITASAARKALIMNLSATTNETRGLSVADHASVIKKYAPEVKFDVVVADPATLDDIDSMEIAARNLGAELMLRQVGVGHAVAIHDPLRLAAAIRDAVEGHLADLY